MIKKGGTQNKGLDFRVEKGHGRPRCDAAPPQLPHGAVTELGGPPWSRGILGNAVLLLTPAAQLTFGNSLDTDGENGAILQGNTEFGERERNRGSMKAPGLSTHPPRQHLEANTSLTRNIGEVWD